MFNVDFTILCKSRKKLSNFCLVDKVGDKQSSFNYIILEPSCTHVVLSSAVIILVRCYNVVYNVMVDEGYTRRIKIGRSRDQFFFCHSWYLGDRKFKLTKFNPDGIQLFLANLQPIPLAQHDVVISLVVVYILIDCVIVRLCVIENIYFITCQSPAQENNPPNPANDADHPRLPTKLSEVAKVRVGKKIKPKNIAGEVSKMHVRKERHGKKKDFDLQSYVGINS
ncbi:hypothetical protein HanPI659440_Chr01g0009771 [Helianthus annuus]|nr:hypothetical protein HanPI659440_Chr01g0009771 [Helianthus annuus]